MFAISKVVRESAAKTALASSLLACAACAGPPRTADDPVGAAHVFYTITGEIALARNEPHMAALQYTAAAEHAGDAALVARASEVTAQTLQPALGAVVAAHWIEIDPKSREAHEAAARAALALDRIDEAAGEYRIVVLNSPRGAAIALTDLEAEFGSSDDVFAARRVADRLATKLPRSAAVLRLQGFCALRANDPAAAVRSFEAALALALATAPTGGAQPRTDPPRAGEAPAGDAAQTQRDLQQGLWRARILAGDWQEPLAQSAALAEREATVTNRLDHALLLLAARRNEAAVAELQALAIEADAQPVALRLLGLIEFEDGRLDAASEYFTQLLSSGKFVDDAFYYLGLIAERRGEVEKALRLYAEVRTGDNAVAALLRASSILQEHGAATAAQEVLDHLIEDDPERAPEVLIARAKILAGTGDVRQAAVVLDRGASEYPDNVDIRYAIASTYEEQGDVPRALRELKQVLKARSDDPTALNAYGYTLADHRLRLRRARALIERAHASAPTNAAILDSLGWVLYRQGRDREALSYLKTAYTDDRGGDIAAHYGEVLWRLGQRDEADRIWNEASIADAHDRVLNTTRERLHAAP